MVSRESRVLSGEYLGSGVIVLLGGEDNLVHHNWE